MTLDSCGCNCHPLSSPPSQQNQAFVVICIWTNRCSCLCLCLHISHECFALLFFCPRLHLRRQIITYVPNPAQGLIVKSFHHYRSTAAMLVTVCSEWNPWNQSPYSMKWWNTAWGQHMGIHWRLLSLGDWQTKLLNPLLRPYVTKHTCYSNSACSAYHKHHSGPVLTNGIIEPTSPAERQ